MKKIIFALLILLPVCGAHWTGYGISATGGYQQNDGEMATRATSLYAVGAKIHFDRDK